MRHNVLFYGLKKRGNSKHFRDFRLLTFHMRDLKLWSWSIFRSSFSECIICEDCCYLNPTVAHSLPEYRWISNSENFIFTFNTTRNTIVKVFMLVGERCERWLPREKQSKRNILLAAGFCYVIKLHMDSLSSSSNKLIYSSPYRRQNYHIFNYFLLTCDI